MPKNKEPFRQFEDIVVRLLSSKEFEFTDTQTHHVAKGYDFTASRGDERWAIEVKYYRTARAQISLIEAAIAQVLNRTENEPALRVMIIVSSIINRRVRSALEDKYGVAIWDRLVLFDAAAEDAEIVDELGALLEERDAQRRDTVDAQAQISDIPARRKAAGSKDTTGDDLCNELKGLEFGKSGWSAYELLCERILRYLFPNDLYGWHKQAYTDDGLNRFDYVCRIKPTTEFWRFLIDHLQSRYVVFEFKNYKEGIKQGQILTTEKYLLGKALRSVAIIFSRSGADESATKMAQGAMREHGKLMLVLNDGDVCDMLQKKQRGEDPTDFLFDSADDFLLTLPR